jgi:hypothetical protein
LKLVTTIKTIRLVGGSNRGGSSGEKIMLSNNEDRLLQFLNQHEKPYAITFTNMKEVEGKRKREYTTKILSRL